MKLNEVCEFIIDCEHKTAPLSVEGEYISIRTPNIGKGHFLLEGVNRVTKDTYEKWTRRGKPKPGDLIMAREAPVGNVAVISDQMNMCLGQRTVLIRPNTNKTDSNFLCYYLLSDYAQNQIHGESTGATVAHLNMSDIRDIDLFGLPDLPIQKFIATILNAYDELMDVNGKRIKLLEETARELYKEWFVRMRFPGYMKAKFVKGIPKEWSSERFEKHIKIVRGKSYTSEEIDDEKGSYPFINLKNINRGGGFRLDGTKFYSGKFKQDQLVIPGDIVMAVTDMTQARSVVGRVARVPLTNFNEYVISLDTAKIVPIDLPSDYIYSALRFNYYGESLAEYANGTNVLHLNPELLKKEFLIVPKKEIVSSYIQHVKPMFELIDYLQIQNTHLRQIRDRLLPRLVTGKLQIKDMKG
jgi:type I restriction enzyme S subunit